MFLAELPDALIHAVSAFATPTEVRTLMQTEHRFRRLLQLSLCLRRLCGPEASPYIHTIVKLIRRVLVIVRADRAKRKSRSEAVRLAFRSQDATRIIDAAIHRPDITDDVTALIAECDLTILAEIGPGLFLDYRMNEGRNSKSAIRRIYHRFGHGPEPDQIRLDVRREIAAFVAEFVSLSVETGGRTSGRLPSIFSEDVQQLHMRSLAKTATPFRVFVLVRMAQRHPELLLDTDVLWSLLRVGIRFPVSYYLKKATAVSPAQFEAIFPLLSPWMNYLNFRQVMGALAAGRSWLLPVLFRPRIGAVEDPQSVCYDWLLHSISSQSPSMLALMASIADWQSLRFRQEGHNLIRHAICHRISRDILAQMLTICTDVRLSNDKFLRRELGRADPELQEFVQKLRPDLQPIRKRGRPPSSGRGRKTSQGSARSDGRRSSDQGGVPSSSTG